MEKIEICPFLVNFLVVALLVFLSIYSTFKVKSYYKKILTYLHEISQKRLLGEMESLVHLYRCVLLSILLPILAILIILLYLVIFTLRAF